MNKKNHGNRSFITLLPFKMKQKLWQMGIDRCSLQEILDNGELQIAAAKCGFKINRSSLSRYLLHDKEYLEFKERVYKLAAEECYDKMKK